MTNYTGDVANVYIQSSPTGIGNSVLNNSDFYSEVNEGYTHSKIRILVFDCWLPGFLYIKELANIKGVSILFVHNSESQLGQPAQEYQDFKRRIPIPDWVKDFSDYKKSFKSLFDSFKPDMVLVTSMHYVEHRSALLFAKKNNIFSAFIPHGIFKVDHGKVPVITNANNQTKLSQIFNKIPRVIYYSNFFHFQSILHLTNLFFIKHQTPDEYTTLPKEIHLLIFHRFLQRPISN